MIRFGPLLEVEMSKKCMPCGKHIWNSTRTKHLRFGPLLEVEMSKKYEKVHAVRETHVEVKMYNTPGVRTAFGSWDVEKAHAARETHLEVKMYNTPGVRTAFGSWDVEKVPLVVPRRTLGTEHVKSTTCSGFDGDSMFKKCAPLWRKAHVQVKSVKKLKVLNLFWCVRCRFVDRWMDTEIDS